jgi:hypothetical protein
MVALVPSGRVGRAVPATLREIRQVAQPLVDSDPRLAFSRRGIVVRRVGHWLHGFSFAIYRPSNQRSRDPRVPSLATTPSDWNGLFWPRTLFQPLYVPARRMNPDFGGALLTPWRLNDWRVSEPDIAAIFSEAAGDAIDAILNVDTPDKFCIWAEHADGYGRGINLRLVECLTHALAGRLSLAIRVARHDIDNWGGYGEPATPAQARRLRRLIRVFEAGQARTNRLLRTFEWITAGHLGLRRWWTWTPAVE